MKKYPILFALILALLLPTVGAAAENATEIYDRAGLEAIAQNPEGNYILMADIDLQDAPWVPIPFNGIFDGNGHTLYNVRITQADPVTAVSVDGNHKEYDTAFAALFSRTEEAHIRNLNLLNVEVDVNTDGNCFAAGLVGYGAGTVIENCSVEGRITLTMRGKMCGVAGLEGFGYGTVTGSKADVTLVLVDENEAVKCEQFLGGAVSCGYTDVENCSFKVRGYASVHGYVHNGGVVGMYHVHTKGSNHRGYVKNTQVEANIEFFEHNTDRRAYCKAVIGENLHSGAALSGNTTVSFDKKEYKTYDKPLLPEKCAVPAYEEAVTAPGCDTFGYTTHTCSGCGYLYRDGYTAPQHTDRTSAVTPPTCTEQGYTTYTCNLCGAVETEDYVAPAHTPGEWTQVQEPTYAQPGIMEQRCTVCAAVLAQQEIPQKKAVESCTLDAQELTLTYKSTGKLIATVTPEDADDTAVRWSSSDERIVFVDAEGNLYGSGKGTAVITCTSADGQASAQCTVNVEYTPKQWAIVILLFGWLWY